MSARTPRHYAFGLILAGLSVLLLQGCGAQPAPDEFSETASFEVPAEESGEPPAEEPAEEPTADPAPALPANPKPPKPQPVTPTPATAAAPAPVVLTVAEQPPVDVEFIDALSSETSVVGDAFSVRVASDIIVDDQVAVPAGSQIRGTVIDAVPTKRIGGQAQLSLSFDEVTLPSGSTAPFHATLIEAGKSSKGKDAATIGGSAAGGAILGRVLDKKHSTKGTAIGAVVGAAVGTAIASKNETDPVAIDAGALITLYLESPLHINLEDGRRTFD